MSFLTRLHTGIAVIVLPLAALAIAVAGALRATGCAMARSPAL